MLCCSCAICFAAAPSSENDHGSMNFASIHRPGGLDHAVQGCRHPAHHRMPHPALDVVEDLAGIALEPAPVEGLRRDPELDDEIAGEVLRLSLAAFLAPQAEQGGFIVAHNDPGIGAADEISAFGRFGPAYSCDHPCQAVRQRCRGQWMILRPRL